jgi:hypothetical protein
MERSDDDCQAEPEAWQGCESAPPRGVVDKIGGDGGCKAGEGDDGATHKTTESATATDIRISGEDKAVERGLETLMCDEGELGKDLWVGMGAIGSARVIVGDGDKRGEDVRGSIKLVGSARGEKGLLSTEIKSGEFGRDLGGVSDAVGGNAAWSSTSRRLVASAFGDKRPVVVSVIVLFEPQDKVEKLGLFDRQKILLKVFEAEGREVFTFEDVF